ncbi:DarT ssDNA thymidine ADP-ribosyltransferase family protein [Leisingera sp. JC11]|uniref:DarT ssDNA thymidine ADP-ribosyltransferase family protein n=1 Tax=Leisingera sp. JC11 TaxID=3042469 RepID=UPI003456C42D
MELLRDRQVTQLLHFTQVSNLPSILEHGLVPRSILDDNKVNYAWSDPWRLDDQLNSISLSVTCFNWKMFSAVRKRINHADWAVLAIDAMILPGAKCRFYARNAASGEYTRSNKSYRSVFAFEEMFEDRSPYGSFKGSSYRTESNLQSNMTTNPQAEILYEGVIPIHSITEAWVEDETLGTELDRYFVKEVGHEIDVLIGPFEPRHSNRYTSWG